MGRLRLHLAAEQLVERRVACEDHGPCLHLDRALTQAAQVRADAHGAARHIAERENVRFCRYRFKFQSNLVWESIKSISNFYFQFSKTPSL